MAAHVTESRSAYAPHPSLSVPMTGQALRTAVAGHRVEELMAYARSLRVAGYRVDSGRLVDELLRNGCATVEDAFGQCISIHVHVPRPDAAPAAPANAAADAGVEDFRLAV
jgi:hypothetical protein